MKPSSLGLFALLLGLPPCAALAQSAPPADLAAMIRDGVTLVPPASLVGAQVSAWRATSGPQLGDGFVCLRLAEAQAGPIAVFFEGGRLLSYRRAVLLDGCERVPYAALPAPPAPKAAKRRAKRPTGEAAAH